MHYPSDEGLDYFPPRPQGGNAGDRITDARNCPMLYRELEHL